MPVFAVESCWRFANIPNYSNNHGSQIRVVARKIFAHRYWWHLRNLGFIGLAVPLMPGFIFFGIAIICLSSGSSGLHEKCWPILVLAPF